MGKIIIVPLAIAAAIFAAGGITTAVFGRERTLDKIKELDLLKFIKPRCKAENSEDNEDDEDNEDGV